MPRGLRRTQQSGQSHFITFSCYRGWPTIAFLWRVAHNCLPLAIVGAQETHSMIRADPTPSEPTFPSLTRVPGETELQQPDDGITQRCDPLPFPFDRRTCKSWIVREGMSVPRRARLRLRPRVRFLENSTSGPTNVRGCRFSAS